MSEERKFLGYRGWTLDVSEKDRGVSLIETMIAVLVAMIGVFSIGSLIFQATVTNKNQGTEVTRATIYAQDKMEKLLSLTFATCNQGVLVNPLACDTASTAGSGGTTGLIGTGWNTGLTAGGTLAPMQVTCPTSGSDPTLGYVDFLDASGVQLPKAAPGGCSTIVTPIAYVRMWKIEDVTGLNGPYLKKITVAVWSQAAVANTQNKPVVIVTSYRSQANACSAAELLAGCQM
jgi:Tfp pilus assembly major pilin PilA